MAACRHGERRPRVMFRHAARTGVRKDNRRREKRRRKAASARRPARGEAACLPPQALDSRNGYCIVAQWDGPLLPPAHRGVRACMRCRVGDWRVQDRADQATWTLAPRRGGLDRHPRICGLVQPPAALQGVWGTSRPPSSKPLTAATLATSPRSACQQDESPGTPGAIQTAAHVAGGCGAVTDATSPRRRPC
jgi:hypothetical protein